ncbi:MAG: hypothetical protein HY940_09390 [Gammaproteobacteria bacterium]|nr:hypothetical protein [Gammaproteobacteria bacterium]
MIKFEKSLIFTVTSGRSGSAYLSQLLGSLPGVHSEHEPEPNFVHAMRRAQQNPAVALAFLRDHKLPAISRVTEPVYAESSHLTCKGFIEPMIQLGLRPGLIFLRRPPREVAWSLLERNTIPGRTTWGWSYLLEPRDPNVLPLLGWETLSDYQLCFWYALEIERRCIRYTALAGELGLPNADVTNMELNDWEFFSRMLKNLGLAETDQVRAAHADISAKVHNVNPKRIQMPIEQLAVAEQQVWNLVASFEPLLQQGIKRRYGRSD